jgi:serine protease inhibitor
MRKTLRVAAGVAAAGLVAAGCGSSQAPGHGPVETVVHGTAASPKPYGAGDTAFGLNVLRAWCRATPHGNLVLSPASLATGLGLAYLGARGDTAKQMAAVLHLPAATGKQLAAGLQAREAALNSLDGSGVTVAQSNQVWADPSVPTLRSYLSAAAADYGAGVRHVPLLSDPSQAVQEINQAISTATRGHIPNLLSSGSLQGVAWMLTDAMYLHAAWATAFQTRLSLPGPFVTALGEQVSATYLHGGPFRTARAGGWTAVSLPYRGGKLSMTALLPGTGAGNCPVPSPAALATMRAGLSSSSAPTSLIALPKVNLSSQVSMNQLLAGLGMGAAFSPGADFAGLSPKACCIGLVEHAATLQVTAQGTVASAATGVGVMPSDMPAVRTNIWFNRPYLLLITDTATGEPLFLARVTDPAAV